MSDDPEDSRHPDMELFVAGLEAEGWRVVSLAERSVLADRPHGARYRLFPDPKPPATLAGKINPKDLEDRNG